MNKFKNPFQGLSDSDPGVARINSNVPREDYEFIRRIRPDGGTIVTTVNTLWLKLINELKRRNITDFTRVHDFEDFILRCAIILPATGGELPRRPAVGGGAKTKTSPSYDFGGENRLRGEATRDADVTANPKVRNRGDRGRGRRAVQRPERA